jgi:hypothetical protein
LRVLEEIRAGETFDLPTLSVAVQEIRSLGDLLQSRAASERVALDERRAK